MDRAPRRLVIVRHAKAESGEEGSDHDRALTSRGRRESAETGHWLADRLDRIDHVWVSSARRARQTWEGIAPSLPEPADVVVDKALYHAGGREVLQHVGDRDDPVSLVVGHNPTMEQVVMALTGDLHGLKPGAAAVLDLAGGQAWRGQLVELWTPTR